MNDVIRNGERDDGRKPPGYRYHADIPGVARGVLADMKSFFPENVKKRNRVLSGSPNPANDYQTFSD